MFVQKQDEMTFNQAHDVAVSFLKMLFARVYHPHKMQTWNDSEPKLTAIFGHFHSSNNNDDELYHELEKYLPYATEDTLSTVSYIVGTIREDYECDAPQTHDAHLYVCDREHYERRALINTMFVYKRLMSGYYDSFCKKLPI
jgi:hypothetical protein